MKKILLLGAVLFAGTSSALAIQEVVKGEYLDKISPNGVWAAGFIDTGSVVIRNLETGKTYQYITDGEGGVLNYHIGQGSTPVSDTGVVVGSVNSEDASYWENGEWHALPVLSDAYTNSARSVTPDGSVICGGLGQAPLSLDAENIMSIPAVWYRQADGSYSEPVVLPHPAKDFTGLLPQYITATSISADGNIVVGQIVDFSGYTREPIIYTRDASGEWSYSTPYTSLLNPENVTFPEYPGEFDMEMPSQESYMTESELAAFQAEWDRYISNQTDVMPKYEDFMTDEEIAEYQAAYAVYEKAYLEWQPKYEAFQKVFVSCLESGYSFIFNNVALSSDGRYYATTREIETLEDPFVGPVKSYYPVVLLTDGSGYLDLDGNYPEINLQTTAIADNGSLLAAFIDEGILPYRAYIFPTLEKSASAVPLEEYIAETNKEVADWMEENMMQFVIDGITSTGQFTYTDFMCSGWAVSTPDLSTIICAVSTYTWEFEDPYAYYSYIFSTGLKVGGVENVTASDASIEAMGHGTLKVNGSVSGIDVFDTAGRKVFSISNPSGNVATGLSGLYIVRATLSDGTVQTLKTAL